MGGPSPKMRGGPLPQLAKQALRPCVNFPKKLTILSGVRAPLPSTPRPPQVRVRPPRSTGRKCQIERKIDTCLQGPPGKKFEAPSGASQSEKKIEIESGPNKHRG